MIYDLNKGQDLETYKVHGPGPYLAMSVYKKKLWIWRRTAGTP